MQYQELADLDREGFISAFGGIYEHSSWIAERAFDRGDAIKTPGDLMSALCIVFRASNEDEKRTVLRAHPDLAGKLAAAKRLTAASTSEQASAGLDALTDQERADFTALNSAYTQKHGFPFIIAVRDHTKASILSAFKRRLDNETDAEFVEACAQVERIAQLRLEALFG